MHAMKSFAIKSLGIMAMFRTMGSVLEAITLV